LFETKSHDLEGEGEEDEETTHTVRAKVFKLSQSNGEKIWADMGVGKAIPLRPPAMQISASSQVC
jgi:nucleoporin NUP2